MAPKPGKELVTASASAVTAVGGGPKGNAKGARDAKAAAALDEDPTKLAACPIRTEHATGFVERMEPGKKTYEVRYTPTPTAFPNNAKTRSNWGWWGGGGATGVGRVAGRGDGTAMVCVGIFEGCGWGGDAVSSLGQGKGTRYWSWIVGEDLSSGDECCHRVQSRFPGVRGAARSFEHRRVAA